MHERVFVTLHLIHRHVCSGADFWSLEFERSDVAGVDQTNFSDQTTGVLQRKNEGLKPLNASLTHPELDQVQNSNHPELESSRSRPSWFPNSNALTTWNIYANLGIQWDMRHETWDMIHDTWYMTWDMRHDTWYMIHDTWPETWDMIIHDPWDMRHDTWHMIHHHTRHMMRGWDTVSDRVCRRRHKMYVWYPKSEGNPRSVRGRGGGCSVRNKSVEQRAESQ